MTDIPEELVERVARVIEEALEGRGVVSYSGTRDDAEAAIRAVLDWQAKEWVEIPRLD